MGLLDIAPELLMEIIRHIGASELRTSVDYLLVSKQWYKATLPEYLYGLRLSTIYLSSPDLERFSPQFTPLNDAIIDKVERLSVRLVGHPSKQIASNPWHDSEGLFDPKNGNGEEVEDRAGWDYWMQVGPLATTSLEGGRKRFVWHTENHQLHPWRDRINWKLLELSRIFSRCRIMNEFSLEASSEDDAEQGPRWDYLLGSSMKAVISALPVGLKSLTLDTSGSTLATSEQDRNPVHLCSLIALRLQDFEQVRIRMRHICPQILDISNNLSDTPSRLERLLIRLSIPSFPEASYEHHVGYGDYSAKACLAYHCKHGGLSQDMTDAGIQLARAINLDMMRITYKSPEASVSLVVADCVRRRQLYHPAEVFAYEDDGRAWDSWEDTSEDLREGPPI